MRITEAAIRFRATLVVFTVLLVVGGIWSYLSIPKESQPAIEFPLVTVMTLYPGASPDEVEQLVTFPLEREIQGVEGIEEIRSTSTEGVSFILIEFLTDISLSEANRRVREEVDLARPGLPDEAEDPRVREINIEALPLLTINLLAPYSLARLTEVAERLQDEIEAIAGVLEAEITGGVEREVQVDVDLTALQGYGLTIDDLARVIEEENVGIPGGSIEMDRLSYQVRVDGRFEDGERIRDLVIAVHEGRPVHLRDVAEVTPRGFRERTSVSRIRELRREDPRGDLVEVDDPEDLESVSLAVRTRAGENILEMAEAVEEALEAFAFPRGTEFVLTGDRSDTVRMFVQELENHIVFGVLLVTLSLLFFLGLRTACLAAASIPLTLFMAFILFRAADTTLNFVILISLIIVLGILVDFTIIVVENIQRYREKGYEAWEGVRASTAEVAWPVTAGLATSTAAFVPLLFWRGTIGEFLRYIPLTMIVTLSSALFVALVLIPVIAGYLMEWEAGREAAKKEGAKGEGAKRQRDSPEGSSRRRIAGMGVLLFLGVVLLLASPVALLVLLGAALLGRLLHRTVLAPGSARFRSRILPEGERRYRHILEWALQRDYEVRHPWLRNAGALAAFTAGVALLLVGGALHVATGSPPSLVALVPGGVLAILGMVGILVHFVETLFFGGRIAVGFGLALGVVLLPVALFQLVRGDLGPGVLPVLMALPLALILIGFAGALFGRDRHGLLTDNRAKVICLALGGLFVILGAFAAAPTGTSFFPDTDPNLIRMTLEAPVGTRLEASDEIVRQAMQRIDLLMSQDPRVEANVKNIVAQVGVAREGMFLRGEPEPRLSRITLNLVDWGDRAESSSETLRKLRGTMERFPGATVDLDQDRPGPPVDPPVQIEISGPEFMEVASLSVEVEDRLRRAAEAGEVPGLVDIVNTLQRGQPEVRVRIDRERASLAGLSTAAIAGTVRDAIEGRIAGTIREEEQEHDIRVRLREEDRATLQSLEALRIGAPEGQVPLVAVAEVEVTTGIGAITRLNLSPVVTLQADAAPGFGSREVVREVQSLLADFVAELPPGYTTRYTGEVEDQEEEFQFLGFALLLGLGLMTLILVMKFNSPAMAVLILIAIVMTMSGVILGLTATRTAFGLFTFLGIISLAGIVADDDIVLVQFIVDRGAEGLTDTEAIIEGAVSRFRQVTLTAVTTIVGLVPLTFGLYMDFWGLLTELRPDFQLGGQNSQFWSPLGGAIMAGLPAATVVTLILVPVVYSVMGSLRSKGAEFFRG